jgi:hypothetical protein
MFTYECALAAVLITASPDTGTATELHAWHGPLAAAIVSVAVDAEILDVRETTYLLAVAPDFARDVKMLQTRFRELLGAPLSEECDRFASRAIVADFVAFNRSYRQDLVTRLALDPVHAAELREAIGETDDLHRIWDTLRDARCQYYYVTVRRQALQMLRDMLGLEAFYRGTMPPHVPVWHFPVAAN